MKLSAQLAQNHSVQVRTTMVLDQSLDDIHEMVSAYKNDLSSRKFFNDVKNYFLSSQKKSFYSKTSSNDFFLKENKFLLEQVLKCAITTHKDEVRDSGHPYLAHVLSVGCLLAKLGFPKDIVHAGILHDVVESSSSEVDTLNFLYKLNPAISFYVYSVSAPKIQDSVDKDVELYGKISAFSMRAKNIFPKAIKCLDSLVNLYDVEDMVAKDGRSAKSRQLRFLATSRNKILPFAKEIDSQEIIPIRNKSDAFSLEEYTKETISHKLYLISLK